MKTNETKAIKILQDIVDRLKALVATQDEEIKRLREEVSRLEQVILKQTGEEDHGYKK